MAERIKVCGRCREPKPASAFYPRKRSRDGLQGWCKDCQRTEYARYRGRYRARLRRTELRRKYGLTPEEYELALACGCAICGADQDLTLDHDHKTETVRKALCRRCNTMLGMAQDDPNRLEAAAAYLRQHTLN